MRIMYLGGLRTGIAVCLLFGATAFAAGPVLPDRPPSRVVDLAGVVAPDRKAAIEALLADLESRTGAQVVILTVKTLDGEPIERFSLRAAERWALGRKGRDDGLLLTVSSGDRQYRFEVGYGLEAILPDSFVGSLGREALVPALSAGDFGGGFLRVAERIAQALDEQKRGTGARSAAARPPPATAPPVARSIHPGAIVMIAIVIGGLAAFVIAGVVIAYRERRRDAASGPLTRQERKRLRNKLRGSSRRGSTERTADEEVDSDSSSPAGGGGRFGGGGASGGW